MNPMSVRSWLIRFRKKKPAKNDFAAFINATLSVEARPDTHTHVEEIAPPVWMGEERSLTGDGFPAIHQHGKVWHTHE